MSKRKRDPTFAASEKLCLIELVEKHFDVVENKKSDTLTVKMKNEEWHKIAIEFNAISSIHPRDWGVLRNCWENLKKRAKQTQTMRNQHFLGTGGGPPKKILEDPATERVLELIQTRVTGFTNTYDSDGTQVLASGSMVNQHGEGTSQQHEECSNDAQGEQVMEIDWSQYTPSMLRVPRHPVLARPPSPSVDEQPETGEEADPQLPVADDPQLSVAGPNATESDQGQNIPQRARTTRAGLTTSRRRPVSRREREADNLANARINTLLKCNVHAEEEHALQMRILQLQEQKEIEILEQEKIKTRQEKIKLEILELELKKLKE